MTTIYLNNAATSWPKPECVAAAVRDSLLYPPASAHRGGIDERDIFELARSALLGLLNAELGKLALCQHATEAINLAIRGVGLKTGDIVLADAGAHNSVLRTLFELERQIKIRPIILPIDRCGRLDPDYLAAAAEYCEPKLCVFTHASNVTGAVNDAGALCRAAKKYGSLTLIDAAQTLGIFPVNVEEMGCDMLAFTGHKYLLAPQGIGGLYFREGLRLSPLLYGGTGIYSEDRYMPPELPLALEAGTPNEAAACGAYAAVGWHNDHPLDSAEINRKILRLEQMLTQAGAVVTAVSAPRTPVLSFYIPQMHASDAADILQRKDGVILRSGLHCAPLVHRYIGSPPDGTLRVSLSRFTVDEELDKFISVVERICRG